MSALIFLNYVGWLAPLKRAARGILVIPVVRLNALTVAGRDLWQIFAQRRGIIEEHARCVSDGERKEFLEAQVKILTEENEELQKQAAFKVKARFPSVGARVIGISPESGEKSVLIDAGEDDGVKPQQPVVTKEGILVGKVDKTERDISFVRLLNDNQNKVAAVVLNNDKSMGVVEGGYGISVRMKFIPRHEAVLIGDQVVTSGLESNVPRGLLIGVIAAVENEAYQPFQEAILTPAVDLSKLLLVSVLLTE